MCVKNSSQDCLTAGRPRDNRSGPLRGRRVQRVPVCKPNSVYPEPPLQGS